MSPQTRSAGLLLLSRVASLLPKEVLGRLVKLLTVMGTETLSRDDSYTFYIVQQVRPTGTG